MQSLDSSQNQTTLTLEFYFDTKYHRIDKYEERKTRKRKKKSQKKKIYKVDKPLESYNSFIKIRSSLLCFQNITLYLMPIIQLYS